MESNKKKIDYKWVIIALCFLMVFISLGFCSSNKSLYLSAITEALGFKRSLFSVGDSIRFISTAVVNMFFGYLVSKFGTKKLIVAGFICLIISMLFNSFANQMIYFYIANLFLGIGFSWTSTAMVGAVVNVWYSEKKGTIMGAVLAANGIGGALAAQIIAPMIFNENNLFGYRNAYKLVALILFIAMFLFIFFFKEKPKNYTGNAKAVPAKKSRGQNWSGISFDEVNRTPYFYLAGLCIFLTGLILQAINGVAATHMKDVGMSAAYVATVLSVHSLALTAFKFLTGVIYDKYGLRVITVICEVTAVLVMGALAMVTNSLSGKVLAMVYGFFSSLALPLETVLIPIIASDMFGQKSFNKIMGIFVSLNYLGYAIGSPLTNWGFDAFGTYTPVFIVCMFLMIAITLTFQFVITATGKKREQILKNEITM